MPSTSAAEQAAAARRLAREILSEGRFHEPSVPRPLHTVLREIGRALESPLNALDELVEEVAGSIPGGEPVVWIALAVALVLVGAALARHGIRRAPSGRAPADAAAGTPVRVRAADLEREALVAERGGRYEEAVRLRFRAGVLALSERELVSGAPTMVNGQLGRILHSGDFEQIARRFDEIAYGGSTAHEQDAELARSGWARVLEEASRA